MSGLALMPMLAPSPGFSISKVGYTSHVGDDDDVGNMLSFTYSNAPETSSRRLFVVIATWRDNDDVSNLGSFNFRTPGGSIIPGTVIFSAGSGFGGSSNNSHALAIATAIVPTNNYTVLHAPMGWIGVQMVVLAAYSLKSSSVSSQSSSNTSSDGTSFGINVTNPDNAIVVSAFGSVGFDSSVSIDNGTTVHDEFLDLGESFGIRLGITADSRVSSQTNKTYTGSYSSATVRTSGYMSWT